MRQGIPFLAFLVLVVGCGAPSGPNYDQFDKPNVLLEKEIQRRIDKIPYQRNMDLVVNLVWLAARGEQAIPQLLGAMKHPNSKVRANAAWTLGRIKDSRSIPFMKPGLHDSDDVVKMEVASSLLNMGCEDGIPYLIAGLDSDKQWWRYHCGEALKDWSGMSFGYNHKELDPKLRKSSIGKWMAWWKDKSGRGGDSTGRAYASPPK